MLGASSSPEAVEARAVLLAEKDLASALGHEGRCHTAPSAAVTAIMTKDVVPGCISLSRDVAEATLDRWAITVPSHVEIPHVSEGLGTATAISGVVHSLPQWQVLI